MCAREMGDPQLALLLGRLMETPQQPLLPTLVHKELLPGARVLGLDWQYDRGLTATTCKDRRDLW